MVSTIYGYDNNNKTIGVHSKPLAIAIPLRSDLGEGQRQSPWICTLRLRLSRNGTSPQIQNKQQQRDAIWIPVSFRINNNNNKTIDVHSNLLGFPIERNHRRRFCLPLAILFGGPVDPQRRSLRAPARSEQQQEQSHHTISRKWDRLPSVMFPS